MVSPSPTRLRGPALTALALALASPQLAHAKDEPVSETAYPRVELSGEFRERLTYNSNIAFDPDEEGDGWFLTQRASLTADADIAPQVRARVTVKSALLEGEAFEPIHRNDLDVQEAFVELGPESAFVRIGRQELGLGSFRLASNRDGTNVKRTWDGARAVLELGEFDVTALALSEVEVDPGGAFNDPIAKGDVLAGIYTSGPAPIGRFDAYLLYSQFDARRTIEGIAEQDRYTLGLRSFGESGPLFWNWEFFYQFGSHGDLDISAWSVATITGMRWDDAPLRPQFMLSANIASGDEENGDGTLGTFDALFPRGNYFSQAAILGPSNFINVNPSVTLHPADNLRLYADVNLFWRVEDADGIYGPPFILIREPSGSEADFVNTSVSVNAEWQATANILLGLAATYAAPGRFIAETGPARDIQFLELTARYRF